MANVKAFNCNFVTVKGEARSMTFVQVADLPQEFITANTSGGVRPALKPGFETVWSIGEGWRTLNRNTATDYVETTVTL